ncbi:hypothetical protein H9P43_005914 [Blastocladiella emersonii ATCC 22665]|nr:hypothetical protein H9P43_005914 [Blastocladiella emersonii ATCC 22665]
MSRVEDGERYMAAAQKAITKPRFALFWKPDHEDAAQNFERAAGCFKQPRPDLAVPAFLASADAWVKAESYFMAAKMTESAAHLSLTSASAKDPARAAQLYKQAAEYFVLNGTPDRAAETMEKAAKAAEDAGDAGVALDLYNECIELHMQEDRPRFAVDVVKRAVAFTVRAEMHQAAVALLERQVATYAKINNANGVSKSALALVIYLLAIQDDVRAVHEFQDAMTRGAFARDEALAANAIFDALDHADPDELARAVNAQIIGFLDPPIVRVARKLQVRASAGSFGGATAAPPVPIPGFIPTADVPPPALSSSSAHNLAPAPAPVSFSAPPPPSVPGFASAAPPPPIPGLGGAPGGGIPGFTPPPPVVPVPGLPAAPRPVAPVAGTESEEEEGFC